MVLAFGATAVFAQVLQFDIESQPLSQALNQIAAQSGTNVLYAPDSVAGIQSSTLHGPMSPRDAIAALLRGTNLEAIPDDHGGMVIRPKIALLQPSALPVPAPVRQAAAIEQILVSASRLSATMYQEVTPVTVLTLDQLNRDAYLDVGDSIRAFPSLGPSSSPSNGAGFASIGGAGNAVDAVNLRNLGVARTLVLFDGQRVVQSNITGGVDLATIPKTLVQRVDIVTGGASAAWGSDAVAGVVNLVVNKNFSGFLANIEAGDTFRDDNRALKLEASWGSNLLADRGHLILSGEYTYSPDAIFVGQRSWYDGTHLVNNPTYLAGDGGPQLIHAANVGLSQETPGGLILSNPANPLTGAGANVLRGIQFVGAEGASTPFNFGNVSGALSSGGSATDAMSIGRLGTLAQPYSNATLFAFGSYAINDAFNASFELNYGQSRSQNSSPAGLTSFTYVTIHDDNAYLNPAIASQMAALGIPSFTLGTTNTNNVNLQNVSMASFSNSVGIPLNTTTRDLMRGVVTLDGQISQGWIWRGYFEHGLARVHLRNRTVVLANFNNAVDAVAVTSTNQGTSGLAVGTIACRSTLTNPANGCKPLDIFGNGVASQAALDYVNTANDWETYVLNEDVASLAVQGALPRQMPAGPVAIAFGGEYRKEGGTISADPGGAAKAYSVGNFTPFSGQYFVTEGFAESDIPIFRDVLVQSLDLNVAGRMTSYSTSGLVETWKLGLASQINDELRLRSSWSLDVRAPNLAELFNTAALAASGSAIDPHTGASVPIFTETEGNPNLKPEEATTLSGGLVVTPKWMRDFSLSLDWYSIDIKRAIYTTGSSQVVQQCNNGFTLYCSQLVYNGSAYPGALGTIILQPLNASSVTDSGLDFQADDTMPAFDGSLLFHLIGNYTDEETQTALGTAFDYAGSLGPDSLVMGAPKFRSVLAATYKQGDWQGTLQERFLGASRLNNAWQQGVDVDNNQIPPVQYLDLRGNYQWSSVQIYFAIDNLLDAAPPQVPSSYAAGLTPFQNLPTRTDIYDALGRSFRLGIRYNSQ